MKETLLKSVVLVIVGVLFGYYFFPRPSIHNMHFEGMDVDGKRGELMGEKEDLIRELMGAGMYRCCLEKPCTYCIEKTPKHGEGASCSCLDDIMAGVHPCGECIGEIMEGHGNKFLAKYFAKAITEEVGEKHSLSIKQIISEKYDIPIEEQI